MTDDTIPPFLTPEELSDAIKGTVPPSDPRIEPLIAGASRAVRRWCRWHITPVVQQTWTVDTDGSRLISLPTMRLVEVTNVTVSGQVLDLTTDLEWSQLGELHRLGPVPWPVGYRRVTITGRHGYDDAPDVAQIITQVVANALASPLGATREQAGQTSITWAQTAPGVAGGMSLLERDLAVLATYRLGNRP